MGNNTAEKMRITAVSDTLYKRTNLRYEEQQSFDWGMFGVLRKRIILLWCRHRRDLWRFLQKSNLPREWTFSAGSACKYQKNPCWSRSSHRFVRIWQAFRSTRILNRPLIQAERDINQIVMDRRLSIPPVFFRACFIFLLSFTITCKKNAIRRWRPV